MCPPRASNSSATAGAPTAEASEAPKATIDKTNKILDKIRGYDRYSLGDFLSTIFKSHTTLSKGSQQVIIQWLAGNTRPGTRPAEIVDAMYRNPSAHTHMDHQLWTANFSSLSVPEMTALARSAGAISFLPDPAVVPSGKQEQKTLYNAREGLEEWAARLVLWFVNQEASTLEKELDPAAAPTWSKIEEFSLQKERPIMRSKAPVLWAVLCGVAFNLRRLAQQISTGTTGEASSSESESESVGDEPAAADPKEQAKTKAKEQAELVSNTW